MSGRKSNLFKFRSVVDELANVAITSAVTNIEYLDNVGIQFVWDGTTEGTFDVQISLDYEQDTLGNVTNPGHWASVLSVPPTASGDEGSAYIDLNQLSAPWVRSTFTPTYTESGSVTTISDVAGSLNNSYFLIDGADGDDWYVWFDNGSGVDPNVPNRTGIQVTYTDGATASTLGGLLRTALAGCTSIENIAGSGANATFDQTDPGPADVRDSTADPTGFTFSSDEPDGILNCYICAKMV